MANAKKCDICGALYESYNETGGEKNPNGFRFVTSYLTDASWCGHEIMDCCPNCMESIKTHIETLKTPKIFA